MEIREIVEILVKQSKHSLSCFRELHIQISLSHNKKIIIGFAPPLTTQG